MSRGRGLAGSSLLMFSGTLVSRVLGMVRDPLLLGAAIGINYGAANAFAVANRLPNMIHLLLAGGVLNAVLVPQIVRAMRTEADGGETYVNRMLTVFGTLLAGATVVLSLAAPLLVRVYGSALPQQWLELAVVFGFWTIPQLFFYGLYTILGQVLNARGQFGPYMWAPAANNVVAIAGLALYLGVYGPVGSSPTDDAAVWDAGRIALLAGTATLGVAAQAVILLWPLYRSGYRYRWDFTWRGSGLGRASRVAMWTFASVVVGQLANIVVINVAAAATARGGGALDVPGPAAYNPAYTIFVLVNSLVVVSIVTALFTRMSTSAAGGDLTRVRADLSLGLRVVGLFTVFATLGLMVLALPLARVIAATVSYPEAQSIARVAAAMLAGLVGMGALTVVQRVYYAFEDTRGLFRIQLPGIALLPAGALLSLLLPPEWILVGVGVAMTVSNTVLAGAAYLGLRRHLASLDGGRVLRTHVRLTLAAAPAALVGWVLLHLTGLGPDELSVVGALWRTVLVGAVMALLYLVALWRLDVPELRVLAGPVGSVLSAVGARLPGAAGSGVRRISDRLPADRTLGTDGPVEGADDGTGSGTLDAGERTMHTAPAVASRYALESELPATVPGLSRWAAHDTVLDRAVEVLRLAPGHPRAHAVLDGARRATLVDDERLVTILDVGEDADDGYVVTAPLTGVDLTTLLTRGPLPPPQARALVAEVASALETARRSGVMHLAVRPDAVRVTVLDTVVVTGLGIDHALLDEDEPDPVERSRRDAVDLVRVLYTALTGHWPGAHPTLPAAPLGDDGGPVPPAQLRSEVPADLDALCRATLAGGPDAVTTPTELLRTLGEHEALDHTAMPAPVPAQPQWRRLEAQPAEAVGLVAEPVAAEPSAPEAGESVLPTPSAPEAGPAPEASAPAPAAGTPAASTPDAAPEPGPEARGWTPHALAAGDPTAAPDFDGVLAAEPTTPTPARHPTEVGAAATVATVTAFAGGVAERARELGGRATARLRRLRESSQEKSHAPADVTQDAQAQGYAQATGAAEPVTSAPSSRPFAPVRGDAPATDPGERRLDPTPWALGVVGAGLLVLAVLAIRGLTAPVEDVSLPDPSPVATTPATAEPEETPEPAAPAVPATIAALTVLDPQGDGAEFPELTPRAIDGDPTTYWRSRRYNDPAYGMKDGIGLAVTLDQRAPVTAVELDVQGTGGLVELRATSPTTPTEGAPLASAEMGATTVLELAEPVETDMLVLWFPRLPTAASDGLPRIELAEIRVR